MGFKDTIVNARKKLESSVDSATPSKVQNLGHGEFFGANEPKSRRSKHACIVETFHASTRKRTGKTQQISHCCEGVKFVESLQSCAQVHSYAPSNENRGRESRCGQGVRKTRNSPTWQMTKVNSRKEVVQKAQKEGRTVYFAALMDICHLKNSELNQKFQKKQRTCGAPKRHCEKRFWLPRCVCGARFVANDGRKKVMYVVARLRGCAGQATDAVSACTKVKMEDAPKL